MKTPFFLLLFVLALNACTNTAVHQNASTTDTVQTQMPKQVPIVDKVLTAEEQAKLTPDTVLQMLKDGNNRFVSDDLTARMYSKQVGAAAHGQYPMAVVLSCIDSRVPVEEVFDKGIGDLFVARVAGNIVNEDILGSMEYGCKVSGSKLILVLGHTDCGAIKSAINNVQLGNITALLSKIKPAVDSSRSFNGEKTYKNQDYFNAVCVKNVQLTIKNIRQRSEILKDMEQKKEIRIVGAIYDMDSGKVTFME